jgi:hypothetical protein
MVIMTVWGGGYMVSMYGEEDTWYPCMYDYEIMSFTISTVTWCEVLLMCC